MTNNEIPRKIVNLFDKLIEKSEENNCDSRDTFLIMIDIFSEKENVDIENPKQYKNDIIEILGNSGLSKEEERLALLSIITTFSNSLAKLVAEDIKQKELNGELN